MPDSKSWDDNLRDVVIYFLSLFKRPLPWVVVLVAFFAVASGNGWIDVPVFSAAIAAVVDVVKSSLGEFGP